MTLDEFKDKTKHLKGDYQISIKKCDKHQLCCSSTVSVEKAEIGFDWTHRQIVLIPATKLVTDPEVVNKQTEQTLRDYAIRCSDYLRIIAKLATLVNNMKDSEDKHKLENVIKEVANPT